MLMMVFDDSHRPQALAADPRWQRPTPTRFARRQIDVPPLREAELRKVVSRPAELLAARFESEGLIDIIARRTAEDSVKDVGALPLLSYTLDDMWTTLRTCTRRWSPASGRCAATTRSPMAARSAPASAASKAAAAYR